jgi:hypothetical protein
MVVPDGSMVELQMLDAGHVPVDTTEILDAALHALAG